MNASFNRAQCLRLLMDIQASLEIIAQMLVHVMTASQERCVEMARKTNTD